MTLDPYAATWLRYFSITLVLEAMVVLGMQRRALLRTTLVLLVANLATHPVVWFVFARAGLSRTALTLVAESWAVAIETLVYALALPVPRARALALSAFANAVSFFAGTVVVAWF